MTSKLNIFPPLKKSTHFPRFSNATADVNKAPKMQAAKETHGMRATFCVFGEKINGVFTKFRESVKCVKRVGKGGKSEENNSEQIHSRGPLNTVPTGNVKYTF
jgi:hypothetical protein